MSDIGIAVTNKAHPITVVDAPEISLTEGEEVSNILLHFYRALGWNGNDLLDPCKIRTTQDVYNKLYDQMRERCPDYISVGMFMVNRGPGVENYIPAGKVYLLEGWIEPVVSGKDTSVVA